MGGYIRAKFLTSKRVASVPLLNVCIKFMLGYYGTVCPAVRSTCPEMSDEIFPTKQQCIASLGIEPLARSLNIVEYGIIWLTILEKNGISTLRQRKLRAA